MRCGRETEFRNVRSQTGVWERVKLGSEIRVKSAKPSAQVHFSAAKFGSLIACWHRDVRQGMAA